MSASNHLGQRVMTNARQMFWVGFTVVLLCVLASPSHAQTKGETRRWEKCLQRVDKAEAADEKIDILEAFIAENPDGPYASQAREKTAEIAFAVAAQADTLDAYTTFVASYPESSLAVRARGRIDDLSFEAATRENTAEGYRRFAAEHPESPQAEEARSRTALLEDFQTASAQGTVDGFRRFLTAHPGSDMTKAAQNEIAKLLRQGKSVGDLVSFCQHLGWRGTFSVHPHPSPFSEVGEFSGSGFQFIIAKVDSEHPADLSALYDKTNVDLSMPMSGGHRGYKLVGYHNLYPFYLVTVLTDESLDDPLGRLEVSLEVWPEE